MSRTVLFHELGGPERLTIVDERPAEPGPGEVRVRVQAIGLNRAEVLFRSGAYIEPVQHFPARLGTEAAGVLDAVGSGVEGLRPGQPVSVLPGLFSQNDYGVYAEYAVVPARAVAVRPEGVDAVQGATTWMSYGTAFGGMVQVGELQAGGVVVLTAASSSVALAAIQVANRIGATPIAVTRTTSKKQALLEYGAAEVIVSASEDVVGRVLAATGGRGADLVFDAVAGPGVVELTKATAPEGTLLVYGALSGRPTPFPGIDLGMPPVNMRTYTIRETVRGAGRKRQVAAFLDSGLRSGALRPAVDRTFALTDIVAAHQYLESNAQFGKSVVTVEA